MDSQPVCFVKAGGSRAGEGTDHHGSRTHLEGHPGEDLDWVGVPWRREGLALHPQVLPSAAVPEVLLLSCPLQAWVPASTETRRVLISRDGLSLLLTVGPCTWHSAGHALGWRVSEFGLFTRRVAAGS